MNSFIKHYKIYLIVFAFLIVIGIIILIIFGLKPGIDFVGGSILEVEYKSDRPQSEKIREELSGLDLGTIYIQPTEEKGIIIKMKDISEETHQKVLEKMREGGVEIEEKRFETIGPTISQELKNKTRIVILVALLSMVLYITLAFRRVQKPLRSWVYGLITTIVLFCDVFIPLSIFSVLGKFYNVEITIPVITALLTVMGYSINNVVVVFDRIRENIFKARGKTFEEIIDISVKQTLSRQINTSLTTLFTCIAIFFFGGETLKYFTLVLILGITSGVFTSIFLANSLLMGWYYFLFSRK